MHRGPSENKKLNCLRWKISYLYNLSLGFACYIFNLIVTRLLTRNNKQENKRISPDWWNHDNLLNLYTVLMFLHVASLRLFQLNFLSLSCLNEVLVPLPVMMCCSPQNPLETSASLPEKVEVISSVCCTSQPWMHLRFAYTSAVNTSSWRRGWLLSVSLAQRLSTYHDESACVWMHFLSQDDVACNLCCICPAALRHRLPHNNDFL